MRRATGAGSGARELYFLLSGLNLLVLTGMVWLEGDPAYSPFRRAGISLLVLFTIALFAYGRRLERERLRRQEAQLAEAQRIARMGSWELDPCTRELTWSAGLYTILGLDPAGTRPSLRSYLALVPPAERKRVTETLRRAFRGQTRFEFGHPLVRRDGVEVFLQVEGVIHRDAENRPVRVLGVTQDITERRAIERMKDEFIATVSHELRTPLTSIRGALGLLASGRVGSLPEKGQRLLSIAASNTDRLARLVNDILDIDRMESGRVTLTRVTCDTATLVRQAVDSVLALAGQKQLSIEVRAASTPLVADPDRLIQALTNLLGNAVKFSPSGSIVQVTAESRGRDVVFSVSDRGRGIPPEKLPMVFDRFHQTDATDSRQNGGCGLGLAISRGIVRQHGGDLTVESSPGTGSTFTIVIPAGTTAEPEPAPGKLVYVCDDDPDTRDVLKFFLAGRGFRIREVGSGTDLVASVAREKPAAILLDLFMPDMNGWETLARLKSDPETCDVPVVVVSILSPEETGETGLELAGWVQKPLDENHLAAVLEQALRTDTRPRIVSSPRTTSIRWQ